MTRPRPTYSILPRPADGPWLAAISYNPSAEPRVLTDKTPAELIAIADEMIARWCEFRNYLNGAS
jgi:hypothetical protein